MNRQLFYILSLFLLCIFSSKAQTFTEIGETYPVSTDGSKYVVSGFVPFEMSNDEHIYANTLLWTVENVCVNLRDRITEVKVPAKSFNCDLVFSSEAGSGLNNIYYCKGLFRVADNKLIYYLSDITIESSGFGMKKMIPMEKLTPDKKTSHQQIINDFTQIESLLLNKMFDFVATNPLSEITHWNEINIRKPVKGMTEDECRIAFGKPQTIRETDGEVQWMYSSSFYLFFKDRRVQTIIK